MPSRPRRTVSEATGEYEKTLAHLTAKADDGPIRISLASEFTRRLCVLDHNQRFRSAIVMSALHPKADMCSALGHVRFGPIADSCTAAKTWGYSITSSARANSVGEISRPSAFAVFRLMTNSNLVDCNTGRSAGLSPFRMRPVYVPTWRYISVSLFP